MIDPKQGLKEATKPLPIKGKLKSKGPFEKPELSEMEIMEQMQAKEEEKDGNKMTKKAGKSTKHKKGSKKVDPEVLKQKFEAWKQTEEFKLWVELSELKKEYPDITETTEDLTGKWQFIENKIMGFSKCFKAKGRKTGKKMKEIKHEHVGSFFFAREDKENFQIDGVLAGVSKEHSDRAWHLRRKFIEIWKAFDDVHDYDEVSFEPGRKKMGKDVNELLKMMGPHIKGPHKEIYYEKLSTILKPLSELLKSNMRLSLFEEAYPDPKSREPVDFKYSALKERFCADLQNVLFVLHVVEKDPEKQLRANPDVRNIFKKLEYANWEKSPIEFFYLAKLRHAFFTARKHMVRLFANGIDYWKIPLSNNQQLLDDLKKLVDYELICERLIGDSLKRDQLNFTYQSIGLIIKTPGHNKLLEKNETYTKYSIPKLLIYKNIQQIRMILDGEIQQKIKDEVEFTQGGLFFQFSVSKIQIPKEILEKAELEEEEMNFARIRPQSAFITSNIPNLSNRPRSALAKDIPIEKFEEGKNQISIKETTENVESKRMWIWERYVDENTKPIFLDAVEELRHINLSVQQDIEDNIITEGLNVGKEALEHRDKFKDEIKKNRQFLDDLKLEDNKNDEANSKRPPFLWNDPSVWEDPHKYRSIAAPQECYKDNRIQNFMEKVDYLAVHLMAYQTPWISDLISRTIDVFKIAFDPKPEPLLVYLSSMI